MENLAYIGSDQLVLSREDARPLSAREIAELKKGSEVYFRDTLAGEPDLIWCGEITKRITVFDRGGRKDEFEIYIY